MNERHDHTVDPDDVHELDALLGAYALDAVDEHDRARVEDYLRIDPRAAAEVRQHREVATMLAYDGTDAPDGVWARIAEQIDGDAPAPGPELAKVFASSVAERTGTRPDRRRRAPVTRMLGVAAAIALLVAGASIVVVVASRAGDDPIDEAYATATASDDAVTADLVAEGRDSHATGVIDSSGHGFIDGAGLPRLDAESTYQLWGVMAESGDVVSIGILGGDPELEVFTLDGDVAALAITIEQAPGVVSDGNPDGAYVGELG